MEPVSKASRSSKIRRQRSHEWKDYDSSSDNDEEKQTFRYEESNNQEGGERVPKSDQQKGSRMYLSLHPSSSSTSDNNSEDSDTRKASLEGQNSDTSNNLV
ncbi:uncharacterized protein [Parasteatoda tepidariorum]|uniref:uncharacterized protein n=1 Tax=Parasteatoda tepidariorum TaxID=114398 RepID=UPI0039BD46F2